LKLKGKKGEGGVRVEGERVSGVHSRGAHGIGFDTWDYIRPTNPHGHFRGTSQFFLMNLTTWLCDIILAPLSSTLCPIRGEWEKGRNSTEISSYTIFGIHINILLLNWHSPFDEISHVWPMSCHFPTYLVLWMCRFRGLSSKLFW